MSERIFQMGPITDTASPGQSTTETLPLPAANTEASPPQVAENPTLPLDQGKKPLPLIGIAVFICLGLLIAAGYLGWRIFYSRPHPSTAPATTAPSPVAQGTAEITPAATGDQTKAHAGASAPVDPSLLSTDVSLINPQPGERYIQISALDTESAHRYVEKLRRGSLKPHLAPGPSPNILRVLIGPFQDEAALASTRTDLQAAGIDCFIREY